MSQGLLQQVRLTAGVLSEILMYERFANYHPSEEYRGIKQGDCNLTNPKIATVQNKWAGFKERIDPGVIRDSQIVA